MTTRHLIDGTRIAAMLTALAAIPALPAFADNGTTTGNGFRAPDKTSAATPDRMRTPRPDDRETTKGDGPRVPLETISQRGTRTGNGYRDRVLTRMPASVGGTAQDVKTAGEGSAFPVLPVDNR